MLKLNVIQKIRSAILSAMLISLELSAQDISLGNVKNHEFLLFGKTLGELSETWPNSKIQPYQQAIEKFTNVGACLISNTDVGLVDWTKIKTLPELEVCLSRIHNSIGSVDESVKWFERQGFRTIIQSYPRGSPPARFHSINAIWVIPTSGALKGRKSPLLGVRARFEELFARAGLSIGIEIDENGIVTHVETGFSRK